MREHGLLELLDPFGSVTVEGSSAGRGPDKHALETGLLRTTFSSVEPSHARGTELTTS